MRRLWKRTCLAVFLCIFTHDACPAETGIVVALNASLHHLKEQLPRHSAFSQAGRRFFRGTIEGKAITIVRSPMGKVNNAITAQALLSNPDITTVFSIAPAGAVDDALDIGDAVIARTVYQHDFGTIKPYGFIWNGVPDGGGRSPGYQEPDRDLRRRFAEELNSVGNLKLLEGTVVSGDQFIASGKKRQWLSRKFNPACVDMGAAAIAQTCHANHVRFLIVRMVTDKAGVHARESFNRSVRGNETYRQTILDAVIHLIREL